MTDERDRLNGIAAITDDAGETRRMRADLAVFARRSGDPATLTLVNQVLRGERKVHEVLASPTFNRKGGEHLGNLEEGLRRMPSEERGRLLDRMLHREVGTTPEEELDGLRDTGLEGGSPVDEQGEVDQVSLPPEEPPGPRRHVLGG